MKPDGIRSLGAVCILHSSVIHIEVARRQIIRIEEGLVSDSICIRIDDL